MRKKLSELENQRKKFIGTFERFGFKRAYRGPDLQTVLLKNIKDENGNYLTDHIWFNLTKGFEKLMLKKGDVVSFEARVKGYVKGYMGYRDDVYGKPIEYDYRLDRPTKVVKIAKAASSQKIIVTADL
jgi:hypothetical protein